MRLNPSAGWKEKLPSVLVTLAVQGIIFAFLAFSFTVITRAPVQPPEVIYLLPRRAPTPVNPMVIDARPKRLPLPSSDLGAGVAGAVGPPTAVPAAPAPTQEAPRLRPSPDRGPDCRLYPPLRSPLCPPLTASQARGNFNPNPPSDVQDEARWAKEKARADSATDVTATFGPGVIATPRGIGIVIQEPLCKLATLLLGGGSCGAPSRSTRPATDAQFQAALDAYHKRRGGGPKPALTSAKPEENGNEKDRAGGPGDDAVPDPVSGAGAK